MRKLLALAVLWMLLPSSAQAACGYFTAKGADIRLPAMKVYLTWDPISKLESITLHLNFAGNAQDFGIIIPTPTLPKLHEMPRDFFKLLAVYSVLKHRELPQLPPLRPKKPPEKLLQPVIVMGNGVLDALDYKIISADRPEDLFTWLKANKYSFADHERILKHYVQKGWFFTVMKVDPLQLKKDRNGFYALSLTPVRFTFRTGVPIFPLKIAQVAVQDKLDTLFYIQAPYKIDLPGDFSYQYRWVPMLQAAQKQMPGGLPGKGGDWLQAINQRIPQLLKRGQEMGYTFVSGQQPKPNLQGRTPTTLEWARKLTDMDVKVLRGEAPYSEPLPNLMEGFTDADLQDPKQAQKVLKVIQERLRKIRQERPLGYLVRHAPPENLRQLSQLMGNLQPGQFLTCFRKMFTRDELTDDLVLMPARLGNHEDRSEYEEYLASSPP